MGKRTGCRGGLLSPVQGIKCCAYRWTHVWQGEEQIEFELLRLETNYAIARWTGHLLENAHNLNSSMRRAKFFVTSKNVMQSRFHTNGPTHQSCSLLPSHLTNSDEIAILQLHGLWNLEVQLIKRNGFPANHIGDDQSTFSL